MFKTYWNSSVMIFYSIIFIYTYIVLIYIYIWKGHHSSPKNLATKKFMFLLFKRVRLPDLSVLKSLCDLGL